MLSSRHELRLALRWIAIIRDQTEISLAATGGVHFADDVIKALLAGADVVQMATAVLRYGPPVPRQTAGGNRTLARRNTSTIRWSR